MLGFPVNAETYFAPLNNDTQQRLLWKIATMLYGSLGLAGAVRVADALAHTGKFWAFYAVTNSTIAAITYAPGTSGGSAAGDTVLAGDTIRGHIISLTLASGTGELYIAPA